MSKSLVIFGAGELAEVAAFYFHLGGYRISAFTVDDAFVGEPMFDGRPVIPFSEIADTCPPATDDLFVAVGYSHMNAIRLARCMDALRLGYFLPSYLSRQAVILSDIEGWNCFVLEHNTVQPFVQVGNAVVMWSGNHVGHHSRIGAGCFLTSHVVVSGGCRIGERCFLGVNSAVADHLTIGDGAFVGMGARVYKDLEAGGRKL